MSETTIMFQKAVVRKGEGMKRGTWLPSSVAGTITADLCCRDCGTIGGLSDHTIKNTGDVTPSVVCPKDECKFHAYIRLENWEG